MIPDTKLEKFGGEIGRVAREKVSMNAVQRTIDLYVILLVNRVHTIERRTKNVMFPSLKKYVSCRKNESSVTGSAPAEIPEMLPGSASSPAGRGPGASGAV